MVKEDIMPRGDRTGPNGMGPMTGRGLGFCNGFNVRNFSRSFGGRMNRRRFGQEWGFREEGLYPQEQQLTPISEAKYIEAEMSEMKEALASMEKRLAELKK